MKHRGQIFSSSQKDQQKHSLGQEQYKRKKNEQNNAPPTTTTSAGATPVEKSTNKHNAGKSWFTASAASERSSQKNATASINETPYTSDSFKQIDIYDVDDDGTDELVSLSTDGTTLRTWHLDGGDLTQEDVATTDVAVQNIIAGKFNASMNGVFCYTPHNLLILNGSQLQKFANRSSCYANTTVFDDTNKPIQVVFNKDSSKAEVYNEASGWKTTPDQLKGTFQGASPGHTGETGSLVMQANRTHIVLWSFTGGTKDLLNFDEKYNISIPSPEPSSGLEALSVADAWKSDGLNTEIYWVDHAHLHAQNTSKTVARKEDLFNFTFVGDACSQIVTKTSNYVEGSTGTTCFDVNGDDSYDLVVSNATHIAVADAGRGKANFLAYYNISKHFGGRIDQVDVGDMDADPLTEIAILTDDALVAVEWDNSSSSLQAQKLTTFGSATPADLAIGSVSLGEYTEVGFLCSPLATTPTMQLCREYSNFSMALTAPSFAGDVQDLYHQTLNVSYTLNLTDELRITLAVNGTENDTKGLYEGQQLEYGHTLNFTGKEETYYNVTLTASGIVRMEVNFWIKLNFDEEQPVPIIDAPRNETNVSASFTVSYASSHDDTEIKGYNVTLLYHNNDSVKEKITTDETTVSFTVKKETQQYELKLTCNDTKGRRNSTHHLIQVDGEDPFVSINTPSQNISQTYLVVRWEKSDNIGLNNSAVYVNGSFRANTTAKNYNVTLQKNGTARITVLQYDDVGNTNQSAVNITVDMEPPDVTISQPEDGSYQNESSVTVSWEGHDAYTAIDHYEVQLDGGSWNAVGGNTSHTFTNLAEVQHTVSVKAVDYVSNNNTVEVSFTSDYTAPTLTITSPEDGAVKGDKSVTVKWKAGDGEKLWKYSYRLDQGGWTNVTTTTTSHTFTSLKEGGHTFYVRAYDRAGNTEIETIGVTVDVSAPTLEMIQPQDHDLLGNKTVTFEYNGSDKYSSVDYYLYRVGGGNWSKKIQQEQFQHTFSTVGEHLIDIRAVDQGGNNATISLTISLDFKKPDLDITVHPANQSVQEKVNFILEWGASDDEYWVDHFEVFVDDGNITTLPNTSTSYTFTCVPQGRHDLNVKAVDLAGNGRVVPTAVLVDTKPPSMQFQTPQGKTFTTDSPTINFTASDAGAGVGVLSYALDGGEYQNTTASSISFSELSNGQHIVDFIVFDKVATGEATYSTSMLYTNGYLMTSSAETRTVNHTASFRYTFSIDVERKGGKGWSVADFLAIAGSLMGVGVVATILVMLFKKKRGSP